MRLAHTLIRMNDSPHRAIRRLFVMNAATQCEMVNSFFRMFGEQEIEEPSSGTDRERIEHLVRVYTERLKEKVPKYRLLPNDALIPDGILIALRKSLQDNQ
jgi:hypothetical protein